MSQELTLSIPTIHCGGCVNRINATLESLPGVEAVVTDAGTKTTSLRYNEDQISQAGIEQALSGAGYPVSNERASVPQRRGKPLNLL